MTPGRLIPLFVVVVAVGVGGFLLLGGDDSPDSSGAPIQQQSTEGAMPNGSKQPKSGGSQKAPSSGEALDLSELDTPKIRKCMERANDPKKPLRQRTQAILACAGPKSEQVRKAALQSCLSFADTAPEPAKARKLCNQNLGK